jgi:hypothetical protein
VSFSIRCWREADDDDEHGGFGVDDRDHAENQESVGSQDEMTAARASAAARGVPWPCNARISTPRLNPATWIR